MAKSCQGMRHRCARCLMLWIFPASWPCASKSTLSFWTLLELVITLSIATNRKMHEPAHPKGDFIIRMQGCFMHFKGWEDARLQRLELQIIGLSLRLLCCFSWFSFFLYLYEIFSSTGSIWQTNKQLNRQNKYQTKGNKHDSQQSVHYIAGNEGREIHSFQSSASCKKTALRTSFHHNGCPCPK